AAARPATIESAFPACTLKLTTSSVLPIPTSVSVCSVCVSSCLHTVGGRAGGECDMGGRPDRGGGESCRSEMYRMPPERQQPPLMYCVSGGCNRCGAWMVGHTIISFDPA